MKIWGVRAALTAAVMGMVLSAAPLAAQWEFQADAVSRYIWRGMDVFWNNKPAFQPSVTYLFGESGFSANLWGSFALAKGSEYGDLNEIDLTLDYSFSLSDQAEMSVGVIAYSYPFYKGFTFKEGVTEELYASIGLPDVLFSPYLTAYYDINLGTGLYVALEGSHSIPLSESLGLDLRAALGYNSRQYIDESGLSDLTLGASLPISLGDWTIAPQINYTFVFLDSVNDENEFWFGISIIR